METIARDYAPRGVRFYYLYKQLAHPELSNYVDPFTLDERLMHVRQAEVQLGSRIPWIADAMTNDLKHALGDMPNAEFIIDPDGVVVGRRAWSNPLALRADLERLIGPVETPTLVADLDLVTTPPVVTVARGIVPRVVPPGRMTTLQIEPRLDESELPFYTKLRAEVDQTFLETGAGTLYLGFHIDPLYRMHWNNDAPPLEYAITAPPGVRVTPAYGRFADVEEAADADPREFLVEITAEDRSAPLDLSVTYYACDDALTFCVPVTQGYTVRLAPDPDAGRVRRAGMRGLGRRGGGRRGFGGSPLERIRVWDQNGDGIITRDEAPEALTGRFDQMDTNADGLLEEDELQNELRNMRAVMRGGGGPLGGGDPVVRLLQFDLDGDGRVTRGEVPDRMGRILDRFDTNGDDVLDERELQVMADQVRRRPR